MYLDVKLSGTLVSPVTVLLPLSIVSPATVVLVQAPPSLVPAICVSGRRADSGTFKNNQAKSDLFISNNGNDLILHLMIPYFIREAFK